VFAPATANSVAKLALGIADSQALTAAGEALGSRRPMVLRPQADAAQRGHPAFAGHLAVLRGAGVLVSDEPPEQPWQPMLDLVEGP
jgi:phosphopantothenoylcysteine synthetase/decarboxylase